MIRDHICSISIYLLFKHTKRHKRHCKMASKRKSISASKGDIVYYWRNNINKVGAKIKPSWFIAEDHCWICGSNSGNQKCHIVPDCMGGGRDPSNLVLLCETCHDLNPETVYYEDYWIWFKVMCTDIYLSQTGILEEILYQRMYGNDLVKLVKLVGNIIFHEDIMRYIFNNRDKYLIRSMASKVVLVNKYFQEKLTPDIKRNIIKSCRKVKLNIIEPEPTIIEEKSVEVGKEINSEETKSTVEDYWSILKDIKMKHGF